MFFGDLNWKRVGSMSAVGFLMWTVQTIMKLFQVVVNTVVGIFYWLTSDTILRIKKINEIPGPSTLHMWMKLATVIRKGTINTELAYFLVEQCELFRKFGMCRVWLAHKPVIIVYRAETVEPIFRRDDFLNRPPEYQLARAFAGYTLMSSPLEEWKKNRKMLNPAFSQRILDGFLPVFNKQTQVFIKQMKQHAPKEPVDIVPYIKRCALDIISETAMGTEIGSQHGKNEQFIISSHEVMQILQQRGVQPWLHPDFIFNHLPVGRRFKKHLKILNQVTKKVINSKKKTMLNDPELQRQIGDNSDTLIAKKRLVFLDLLLYHHLHEGTLSEEDVLGAVNEFMFSGHDTSSSTISWALFLVANNQSVQEKVHAELDSIFGDDKEQPITMDHFKDMTYLKCVIQETLRLYPAGPYLARISDKDLDLNGYIIPARTIVAVSIYHLNRDPRYFPEPEVFKPERFLPGQNEIERHHFAYIPFSAGQRNCIGQNYARYEMLVVLADIFRNFTVKAADPIEKAKFRLEFVLLPDTPLRMYLTPR